MLARAAIMTWLLAGWLLAGQGALAADLPAESPEEARAPEERAPSTGGPEAHAALSLSGDQLRAVPGTWGDPLRALSRFPGATPVAGGAGPLVVRGRFPDATPTYVDGVRVSWPFHALVGPAVLSPALVERVDCYRGEAPARFGFLAGGAIDLHLPEHPHGTTAVADLDLLSARATVISEAGPLRTRVLASAGAFHSPWLLSRLSGVAEANLADWQLSLAQPLSHGELRLLWLGAYDGLALQQTDSTLRPLSQMHRVDLRFRSSGGLEVSATYGLDRLAFHGGGAVSELDLEAAERALSARVRWTPPPGAHALPFEVELGAEVERRQADFALGARVWLPAIGGEPPPAPTAVAYRTPAIGVFTGAWAQATARRGSLTFVPGVRLSSAHRASGATEVALEPRLWVDHRASDAFSVHGGAGWYHQPVQSLVSLPGFQLAHFDAGMSSVIQTSAGVTFQPGPGVDLGVDAYWDPMLRVVEVSPLDRDFYDLALAAPSDSAPLVAGKVTRGSALGLEILLRKSLGDRVTGWISYSVQRSVRSGTFQRLGPAGLPLGEASSEDLPFELEHQHALDAVVAFRLPGGWTLSGALLLRSGAPEVGSLVTSRTRRQGTDASGAPAWLEVSLDEVDRLPPLLRVDARVARTFDLDPLRLEVWLDVYDASFSPDVVGFSYGTSTGASNGQRTLTRSPMGLASPLPMLGVRGSFKP